jgi:hypothetical protein
VTPDGRYFVVRGRLWRRSNPALPEEERSALVRALMDARRDIARARRGGDPDAVQDARRRVQAAKEGLGERGAVWWTDGSPDYNRHLARNTPYRDWYASIAPEEDAA